MAIGKKSKIVLVSFASFVALVTLGIWFLANYITTYVNDNSESWIGRKGHVADIDINIFSGTLILRNVEVYEQNGQDVFASIEKLKVRLNLPAIYNERYVVSKVLIDGFDVTITQQGGLFNFQDIIDHFSSGDTTDVVNTAIVDEPIVFAIKDFSIINTNLHYIDAALPYPVNITELNFTLPSGFYSDRYDLEGHLNFAINNAGKIITDLEYGMQTDSFTAVLGIENFSLKQVEPYLREYFYFDSLDGVFNAQLILTGLLMETAKADIAGNISLRNAALTDTLKEELAAFDELSIDIDSLNASKNKYAIKKVRLSGMSAIYHLRKDDDNFSALIKPINKVSDTSETIMALKNLVDKPNNFFAELSANVINIIKNYEARNLHVDTVLVKGGSFQFYDHTLLQPFRCELTEIEASSNELYFDNDSINFNLSAELNESGNLYSTLVLFPKKAADLKLQASLIGLDLVDVSPYSFYYLGHQIDSGKIDFKTSVLIKDSVLHSANHVHIDHLVLGKKSRHEEIIKLPIKTAVAALKDRKGLIELDIPIEGDLGNPDYKLGKTIGRVLKNLIVKAASRPVKVVGKIKNPLKRIKKNQD